MASSGGVAIASGREQARATPTATARTPDLSRFYRYRLPAITPGDFAFHLELLRPKLPDLPLDAMTNALSWDDEQATLTGSVTLYRPDPADPSSLPITRGHLVRCSADWNARRYRLWTMRCDAPVAQLDTGQVTVGLQDDMALLDTGKRDWWYRKTKRRPYGYRCDQIAQAVAATLGLPVRRLARGTTAIEVKLRGATGLAVIRQAYSSEQAASGRSFVLRIRDGALEVVPLARNPILYALADQIQTALLTQAAGAKVPTTVLTGRGRVGSGKATTPVSYTEYDRQVVRLLGYVHDTKDFGRVDSHADLRAQVQRELAKRLRLVSTVSISHQGIPFILRGDAVQVSLPAEGFHGANSVVFCTRATHTVQAGVYTGQWDFTYADPYLAPLAAAAQAAAKRKAKRTQRARPKLQRGAAHG